MPLLAYTQSGEPLVAPLISDAEWEQLRSSTERDAWMPESRRRAIPKVSRLGTRFFAHPPGHAPEGGRESDLHLYLKAQCLIGARAAGWDALPEQSGQTSDGQDWRSDVLCRRPGLPWSIALEAQVQLQGEEAYRKRQERFAASGIRGFCQGSRHWPWRTGAWSGIGPPLMEGWTRMRCLECGSEAVSERSERTAQGYRRFRCRACGKQFNERSGTLLNRTQYPSDVIALVVLWRLRYKLSLRDLPEMFAVRGIVFSHEAARDWEAKLTPALAEDLRRRRRG